MKLEAKLCLQCGSMSWSQVSDEYVGNFHVRRDGHIAFMETFANMEYVCNGCGSTSTLLGVKATPPVYRELIKLKPMQRILRALELVADGKIEVTDSDLTPDEVMEGIECFKNHWLTMRRGSAKAVEEFVSKAKGLVARWKLLEEP